MRFRTVAIIVTFLLVLAACVVISRRFRRSSDPTLMYQGAKIRLAKDYKTYEDYKDDEDNLSPEGAAKAQLLLSTATVSRFFPDWKSLIEGTACLQFPGYGMGSNGNILQADGSTLSILDFEIPKSQTSRYLVFQNKGQGYVLVDDFICPDSDQIVNVTYEEGSLNYQTWNRAKAIKHPLR